MKKTEQCGKTMPMTVTEGVTVTIIPNKNHEFLMTTREVAHGYGTSKNSVFQALHTHPCELVEGKHFISGVNILCTPGNGSIQHNSILFTKRGIVRLGFFIKSERAKLFRDWAEELIIRIDEQRGLFDDMPLPQHLSHKRNHNRLTQERLVSILADVCQIDDKELRLNITSKLLHQ